MLFNSYTFVFGFLPIVLAGFIAVGWRFRASHSMEGLRARRKSQSDLALGWLLLASLAFYAWWKPQYVVLLAASVVANFSLAKVLLVHRGRRSGRLLLGLGIAANLAVLAHYKYLGFFVGLLSTDAAQTAAFLGSWGGAVLPLAISFFTFQQIAYLVDVSRGQAHERSLLRYGLFVTFFPQLIAGPIVHHADLLPQLERGALLPTLRNASVGATLFAIGLFKKVVIADWVMASADPTFDVAGNGFSLSLLEAWVGALAYSLQIYYDFSGYSDMASGLARVFGVRLPLNFDAPYKSTSIVQFWRRWHMTLSRFLRDYLYIPLGGSRKGRVRRYGNLLATMVLGGFWHGAGWTFLLWGALHGGLLCVNHLWSHLIRGRGGAPNVWSSSLGRGLGWALTFAAVVFAWVPFRAPSLSTTVSLWSSMVGLHGITERAAGGASLNTIENGWEILVLLAATLVLPPSHHYLGRYRPALGVTRLRSSRLGLGFVQGWVLWRPTPVHALLALGAFLWSVSLMHRTTVFLYFSF